VSLSKPVFDGTFGANCPPCKEFGQTVLKKLYAAEGIAQAVEFQMHSAIRSSGSPTKDHAWACPDEDPGCPMTKWFICAVNGWNNTTTTQDQRVNFLTCWDDAQGSSEAKAKTCSKQVGFDFKEVSACNSGPKGEALQLAAAEAFEKRFPSHAHRGMFEVPHIFINGKDIGTDRDYDTVLNKLCSSGIKAGACNNTVAQATKDVFTLSQNCAVPGHCGRAYQACCFAYGKKGYPCGCHLQDGSPGGAAGSSCGVCGAGYAACCTAYKAKGFPCTCDVEPALP
jgi:glutaredoxin